MTAAALVVACTLLLVPCLHRLGPLHPVTVTVLLWLLIGAAFAVGPLRLVTPGTTAVAVVLLGLVALCAAPVLLPGAATHEEGAPSGSLQLRVGRFVVVVAVVSALVVWGVLAYRQAVSVSLGIPFAQADPKLVRYAELFGGLRVSPAASIAFALAPLLGALGVVGGLLHRAWWYLLVLVALGATMQSPSRTGTLTVAVTVLFTFLALSRAPGLPWRRRALTSGGAGTTALLGVVAVAGVAYFGYVATRLDKAGLPAGLSPAAWVPDALLQPLLYQMGGLSAFTVDLAQPSEDAGPYGAFGRSLYVLLRAAGVFGLHLDRPADFATYVDVPVPFNTYTAFGDTYVDVGAAGVVVVFGLLGLLIWGLQHWPRPGHPGSVWVLAVLAAVLIATPVHMRAFDGDTLVAAVSGALALTLVTRWTPAVGAGRRPTAGGAVGVARP